MTRLRRFLSLGTIAALLALTAVVGGVSPSDPWPSGPRSASAAGCGDNGWWHQIGYTSASNTDPLGQSAATDITMWQDGCGNAQVRLSVWSPSWSTLHDADVGGRIWVCGGSGGGNPSTIFHIWSTVYWSGWFNASNCGVGVDDAWPGREDLGTSACTSAACYYGSDFGVFYDHL